MTDLIAFSLNLSNIIFMEDKLPLFRAGATEVTDPATVDPRKLELPEAKELPEDLRELPKPPGATAVACAAFRCFPRRGTAWESVLATLEARTAAARAADPKNAAVRLPAPGDAKSSGASALSLSGVLDEALSGEGAGPRTKAQHPHATASAASARRRLRPKFREVPKLLATPPMEAGGSI
mmetsp:Transcript_88980/g.212405  ORF Transcript_88980/g.212405 Transcript_88980/m.212405 type:complete len:181 (+) Transcript_88980:1200-1742(+)